MDSNEYAGSQYWESTGTMLTGRLAGQKSACAGIYLRHCHAGGQLLPD